MTSGQTRWNQKPDEKALTTTMIVTCTPDGQIHMETGDFSTDYNSPQEATAALVSLFEQGIQEAKTLS